MIRMPSQNEGMATPAMENAAHHVVDPGVLLDRRDGAERNGDQDRRQRRHDGDLQRELEAQPDLLDDRPPGPHRLAEIERGQALDEDSGTARSSAGRVPISARQFVENRRIDAAAAARQPQNADVAGDQAHQQEDEHGRPEQRRDHQQQPLDDIGSIRRSQSRAALGRPIRGRPEPDGVAATRSRRLLVEPDLARGPGSGSGWA